MKKVSQYQWEEELLIKKKDKKEGKHKPKGHS